MKRFINVIILILLVNTSTAFNWNFLEDSYDSEKEFGICAKTYMYHINDEWNLKLRGWTALTYGNKTHVDWRCKTTYNTIIHSHPPNHCDFSNFDIKWFNESRTTKVSMLYCYNGTIKYMFKDHKKIIIKTLEVNK